MNIESLRWRNTIQQNGQPRAPARPAGPNGVRTVGSLSLFVRRPGRVVGSTMVSDESQTPAASAPPSVPRVGLLIETQVGPGRDILRGVARYVREGGPWALHLE